MYLIFQNPAAEKVNRDLIAIAGFFKDLLLIQILEDFLVAMRQIQKMGPLESLLGMLPGATGKALKQAKVDPKGLGHVEAMVLSMTPQERRRPELLNGSRRLRIARGSGRSVQELNKLLKQFQQMKKMMKQMGKFGLQ